MKTAEQIAQWVIDNRYPKSENNKVSDSEMYHELVDSIAKLCTIPDVGGALLEVEADYFENVACEIDGEIKEMHEYRILVEPDSHEHKRMHKLFGWQ